MASPFEYEYSDSEEEDSSSDDDTSSSDTESVCSNLSSYGGGEAGSNSVYVGAGLPEHTTEQHIRSHFSQYSSYIEHVQMIRDHQTKKFKGFAFVRFVSAEIAERAVTCFNRTKLLGRTLRVSPAGDKKQSRQPRERKPKQEGPKVKPVRVSASGFPSSVLDSALQAHFASCNLLSVKRPRHRNQGKVYTVTLLFPDMERATRAVRCLNNGKLLGQYPLKLQLIEKKKKGEKKQGKKKGERKSKPKSRVLVTNIPPTMDTDDIKSLFGKCGDILSCSYTSANKKEIGIVFGNPHGAQVAIDEFNGNLYHGRKLRVVLPGSAARVEQSQNNPMPHPGVGHPPAGPGHPSAGRGHPSAGPGHPPAGRGAGRGRKSAQKGHPPPPSASHHPPSMPPPSASLLPTPTPNQFMHSSVPMATCPPRPPGPTAYSQPPPPVPSSAFPSSVPQTPPRRPSVPMVIPQTPPPAPPMGFPPTYPQVNPPPPAVPSYPQANPPPSAVPSYPQANPPPSAVPSYPQVNPPPPAAPSYPQVNPPPPAVPSYPQVNPPPPAVPTYTQVNPSAAVPMSAYPSHSSSSQLTWSTPISVDLYQFVQEHAAKEIDTFIGRGGSIDHHNGQLFIRAGDITEVDQFSKLVMSRYSEQQLACSPDQWNALVMAGPTGARKVDELRLPFASNPSVVIVEKTSPCLHILFIGLKDAMLGAYNHFCASLNKELPVDKLTMCALVALKCDLATKISQQHTVQIDGYHKDSTKLYFTGTSENVVLAKKEMETHITSVCKTNLPGSLSPQLMSLAALIFSKPGAKGVILSSDTGAKCVYCCSQEELAECEKLLAKPSTSTIAVEDVSTIDIETVRSKVDSNTVVVSLKEKAILIEGFDKKHVRQARKLILQEVAVKVEQEVEPASQALLPCTVMQRLYLQNLLERLPEGEALKQSLPVTISCEKDGIYIMGVKQDRETASHTLLEKVPAQSRSVSFTCHKNMYKVIEKHILQPSSGSVEWIKEEWDSKPTCFKIVLFSRKAKHVERVRKNLEEITPTAKWASVKDKRTITSAQDAIESKYRCSLTIRPEEKGQIKIAINALTEEEAVAVRDEINKLTGTASDKHVHSTASDRDKYIRISGLAMKFLLVKHEAVLKQLKESCQEFHYPHFLHKKKAFDITDEVSIKVVGSPQDKQGAENTILFLLGSFTEARFDVQCINASLQLEKLNSLGRAYEKERNLLIESRHNPSDIPVSFVIYGPDKQGVEELKSTIEQACGSPSVGSVPLDPGQSSAMDSKPVRSKAKPKPVVSEVCSSNPVVNLVFSPSCNLDFYKKAQFLAQKEQVSLEWKKVWSSPCISLRGAKKDVASVKHKIEHVLIPEIKEMLGGAQLMVNPLLLPAMSEKFCQRLNNQLKEELCVIATFPRLQKTNTLLKKVSFAQRVTVIINNGTIIYEACDAIVVPASSDLHHSSGLAKLVSEVGGPMLQLECTEYVQQNGVLQPGTSVALGAGFLPCMNVIYTVVPQWYDGGHDVAKTDIFAVVQECLKRADHLAVKSVAFPSINCGDLLKTPEPVIAAASLTAVKNYLQMNPASGIDTVVFALNNLAEQEAFLSALSDVYGDCISPPTSPIKSPSTPVSPRPVPIPARPAPDPSPPPRSDSNPLLSNPTAAAVFNAVTKLPGLNKLSSIVKFEFLSRRSSRDSPPVARSSGTAEQAQPRSSGTVEHAQPLTPSLQWYWANDHGSYTAYSNEVSVMLSQEYHTRPQGSAVFLVNDTTYWLDFSTMKQTNVDTGYKRQVMHQPLSAGEPQMNWELVDDPSAAKPADQQRQTPAESEEPTHCVKLYGPEENLEPASKWIGRQLDSRVKNDSLTLPIKLSQKQEENLQRIASKHFVEMQINDSGGQKTVGIRGVDFKVEKAVTEMEQVISNTGSSSSSEDRLPPWWIPSNVTLRVFSVKRGTAEWNHVQLKFNSTIPHARIRTIDRIQNKWLWKRYTQHRDMLKEKNHGLVNEMELFHGTGDTPPTRIYNSEEGFDMRFSAEGMWGQANYFAGNASYSDSYAHKNNMGYKEIFLAKVLTGNTFSCQSDRSLRMPPLKDSSGMQLGQVRYDTVTGVTGGSQVYMTYDNQKAYPAYLITY